MGAEKLQAAGAAGGGGLLEVDAQTNSVRLQVPYDQMIADCITYHFSDDHWNQNTDGARHFRRLADGAGYIRINQLIQNLQTLRRLSTDAAVIAQAVANDGD